MLSLVIDTAISAAGLVIIAGMSGAAYYLYTRYDGLGGVKEAVTTKDADLVPTLRRGFCAPVMGAYQGVSARVKQDVADLRVDAIKED